jgi:hypothetical protein
MGTRTTLAWWSVLGLATCSGTAFAADPDPMLEKIAALEKQVEADIAAKAYDALVGDGKSAVALHKEAVGKDALRDRLLAILGGLTRVRADDVCKLALLQLGETGDLKGAKYLRSFLRPVDAFKIPIGTETSIEVAKKLPDSSLVEPLLDIVDASKNVACAAKAVDALGYFGGVKNKREKILVELCKSIQRNKPGQKGSQAGGGSGDGAISGGGGSGDGGATGGGMDGSVDSGSSGSFTAGQAASARWPALSAALPGALNKLTGTVCGSAEDWFGMVKEHKSSLKLLFVADGAAAGADAPPK